MTTILDHLAAADAVLADHLCTPGVLRPIGGDAIDPVSVAIERPTAIEGVGGGMGFAMSRPVAWLPVTETRADGSTVTVTVRKDSTIEAEGRAWLVVAGATRPGDGRWWRVEVEDQGPL